MDPAEGNTLPMNSTQLCLRLDWGCEPWEGCSPRGLTRGSKALFLRRKPQKTPAIFVDPNQYDLFRSVKRVRRYGGAPLLAEI